MQLNAIMNGMGQNGIDVVKKMEENAVAHGMHTYHHNVKDLENVSRIKRCL